MNKLVALLPGARPLGEDSLFCWQLAPDGQLRAMTHTVRELAQTPSSQVVVVVPAALLSWHCVVLPPTVKLQGDTRLLPVLQSLLEEALLDEPDQLHIALMPDAAPGQPCTLAVCDRGWLGAWLEVLERAGIKVDRLVPEMAPDVLGENGLCTGATHSGWVSLLSADGMPLTVPLHSGVVICQAPRYEALPATYSEAEHTFGRDRVQLLAEQDWMQRMLQTRWELMQHGFASNTLERLRRKLLACVRDLLHAPQWRASRMAVLSLAAVCVLGTNLQLWQLQRELKAKQDAVLVTVQQTFPQLRVIVDAPLQMQRELETLRQKAGLQGAEDLEPMAAAAGAALKNIGVAAQALEYNGAEMLLRGVAVAQLGAVNEQLRGSRYVADLQGDVIRLKVQP